MTKQVRLYNKKYPLLKYGYRYAGTLWVDKVTIPNGKYFLDKRYFWINDELIAILNYDLDIEEITEWTH